MSRVSVASLLVLLLPLAAAAHPGHGSVDGNSLLHYLTEPVHAAVIVAAAVFGAIGVALWRRRVARVR